MDTSDKKLTNRLLVKNLYGYTKPYRVTFFLCIFLAIALAPVDIIRPYLIQKSVDDYILTGDAIGLWQLTLLIILLLVAHSLMRYFFIYATSWLGQSVIRDIRVKVFQHATKLSLSYFDRTPIGRITTRTINDIETINTIFSEGLITIFADLLTLIAVLFIMFYTSWKLTFVCLTTVPFLIYASYVFKEKVKSSYEIVRTQISNMNAFLQERISGMRIVQMFNAEEKEMKKFKAINRAYTQANLDSVWYYAVFFPVVELLSAASLGLMVWYGAKEVLREELSIGLLVAFPLYLGMLFRPIRMLADKFNSLQMGLVAAERVMALLNNNSVIENSGKQTMQKFKGDISFENVWFSYVKDEWVLKNLSFKLNAGETVAIVGSTGSGKTTIISLLNRFYDIQQGSIRIDGTDIQNIELQNLRSRIAIVLQEVFLFSGSVMDNIRLLDNSISSERVIEASKTIGAHDFIMKLPGGYDYKVMERGATLSMGQRQLISFVRALVFDPDVLILDEATSSIDPETELVIQHAIETLIAKRSSIIIAHRLSTIRHADNIMVLHKGELKEFGKHNALLQIEGGHYRELYEIQFTEQEK